MMVITYAALGSNYYYWHFHGAILARNLVLRVPKCFVHLHPISGDHGASKFVRLKDYAKGGLLLPYRGFFNANINGKYDSFERIKKGLHHGSLQLSGSAIDPLANFTL